MNLRHNSKQKKFYILPEYTQLIEPKIKTQDDESEIFAEGCEKKLRSYKFQYTLRIAA